jgi:hypothetical protein
MVPCACHTGTLLAACVKLAVRGSHEVGGVWAGEGAQLRESLCRESRLLAWKTPSSGHPRRHDQQAAESVLGLQTSKQRDCTALAETAEDNAIVWNASRNFAGNDVINQRFALRKAVGIEIALVFKVFVERLDVKPGAKGCEAECFLAGNNDSMKAAPSRHASSSVDGDGARRSVGENELGEG